MTVTQANRPCEVHTPLGADVLLFRRMTGTECVSRLFEYDLEVVSTDPNVRLEDLLGQNTTVRLDLAQGTTRYWNGYVSGFSFVSMAEDYAAYKVTLHPWFWLLTRSANCRIFQKMTVPDIAKKVFQEKGFTDFEDRLSATYRTWEYCVQYRESDYNFISRLFEEEGIFFYFQHESGKHTLIMGDGSTALDPIQGPGSDIRFLSASEDVVREGGYVWDVSVSQAVQPGACRVRDFNPLTPRANLEAVLSQPADHDNAGYEVYDYPGKYIDTGEGDTCSRLLLEGVQARFENIRGESNHGALAAGHLFTLTDMPRQALNREYLLTETNIDMEADPYRSGSGAELKYACHFTALDSRTPFRPERITPKPTVRGPQTAIVTGPPGEEIHTETYGRVKVQFHWDREGVYDENSSCWVRVSHPWAGKGWGTVSIPRIGQEVIVDFLEGDPDRPIITGRVYNADTMPPYDLPAGGVVSGLKTNSTKGGGGYNEMSMDDTKGKEKITIHGQYDMATTVEHDQSDTVHNNRTISIDGTHTEKIEKDTSIEIAKGNLTHKVSTGTATYEVKGAVTETFRDTQSTTVNKAITITSETSQVHMVASTEIKLTVGASTLLMTKEGKIELSGTSIAINGSKSVDISGNSVTSEATADNNTKGAIVVSSGTASNTVKGGVVMLNP